MRDRPQFKKLRKPQKHKLNLEKIKKDKVIYGTFGIKALESHFIHPKQLESIRKILVRSLRKNGKKFFIVNRLFPHWGFTEKSQNARMGKGKGKVKYWYCMVTKGQIIFEWSQENLSVDLSKEISMECNYKLPIKTKLCSLH